VPIEFSSLDLKPNLLSALKQIGYQTMTPIQEETIPHILAGRDVLGLAETGSGKTAACGVPLVQLADARINAVQALIIVPTRELAQQYVQEVDNIAGDSGVIPFAIFGGFDMDIQRAKLRHGVQVLVATPGRLIDFIWNTKLIDLTQVRTVVLDEADEMLNMGFIDDIDLILSFMIHEHQTLLFSATMPREIEQLANKYLKDPERIRLNKNQKAPQSLQHHFHHTNSRQRQAFLVDYLQNEDIQQAILFCNSRDKGGDLYQSLKGRFNSLEFIHGGLDQDRRTSIFTRFKEKKIKLLVATDVAGRGLDFTQVSHVINFDFPHNIENYTHRTGRTGRMGRLGVALTLVTDRDLRPLQKLIKINDIKPMWAGAQPDLEASPQSRNRNNNNSQRGPRRRPHSRSRRPSSKAV
jgi:ATP-dependent RNA helicase DeaD